MSTCNKKCKTKSEVQSVYLHVSLFVCLSARLPQNHMSTFYHIFSIIQNVAVAMAWSSSGGSQAVQYVM